MSLEYRANKFFPRIYIKGQITLCYFFFLNAFLLCAEYFRVESLDSGPNSEYCTIPGAENTMAEEIKPKLIVFDLDYTLWPFWVDTHVYPPFTLKGNGKVYDFRGSEVKHYSEVPDVLKQLQNDGYKLGIASRTGATEDGKKLVELFGWEEYFQFSEIYPGGKTEHFSRFHEKSKIPYEDMLFFDDENRNIVDVSKLGVTCILVNDGVTKKVVQEGLQAFAKNKRKC